MYCRDVSENFVSGLTPYREPAAARQGRLPAVKRQIHHILARLETMPPNSLKTGAKDWFRHNPRALPPRAICLVIHITIGAIQVAPRHHFEREIEMAG